MITVIITDQGYNYIPFAGWQYPEVTPVPKARFNAQNPGAELTSNGRVEFVSGVAKAYPRVKIPNMELYGFDIRFRGNRDPEADDMRELRYRIKQPSKYTAELVQFVPGKNFHHRQFWTIQLDGEPQNWQEGQEVKTDVATATLRKTKGNKLWVENASHTYYIGFKKGMTITNTVTGESFKITRPGFEASNNKFSAQWVGPYSNGGMIVEYARSFGVDSSYLKPDVSTSYIGPLPMTDELRKNPANLIRNSGAKANQLPGQPKKPPLFEFKDNGKLVNILIERWRDEENGGYRIWKSVDDKDCERLELFFESFGHPTYTTINDNAFDWGYIFGWSNSGFDEDVTFYLTDWQLWFDTPTFIKDKL